MEETKERIASSETPGELRSIVRGAIEEFLRVQQTRTEPAYKVELMEERKKREVLERRINELAEENRRSRMAAEEIDRGSSIRTELQRLGCHESRPGVQSSEGRHSTCRRRAADSAHGNRRGRRKGISDEIPE